MTASAPPRVFDRSLVRRRLARAARAGGEHFLLERATGDLLERLSTVKRTFRRVLDLGTPRPTLTRALRDVVPDATVVRAASVPDATGRRGEPDVVADEDGLPFAAGSFDLAVSLLSLHALDDLPGALVQLRRALRPDGLFLGCLFGGQTLGELRNVLLAAELELRGGASPRVAPFSDLRDLGGLLQRAGFALPVADTERLVVRYRDPLRLLADLRAMGMTNALAERRRLPETRRLFTRAAELYRDGFADAEGRLPATFELIWLSGWAPHESQQKPLKPGSARVSLADALAPSASGNNGPNR